MLSVFPGLLSYWLIGVFFLRLSLGLFLFFLGTSNLRELKNARSVSKVALTIAGVETLCGLLLIVGLFTQVAALITAIVFFLAIFMHKGEKSDSKKSLFYLFVVGASLSLLFLGPGVFALDLPL